VWIGALPGAVIVEPKSLVALATVVCSELKPLKKLELLILHWEKVIKVILFQGNHFLFNDKKIMTQCYHFHFMISLSLMTVYK
jgi:hypothetical protein